MSSSSEVDHTKDTISMSNGDTAAVPPHVVESYFGLINILSDGTVVRRDESMYMPPVTIPDVPSVQWKDVVYDAAYGLAARVYGPTTTGSKLPVLVYFHGGGYVQGAISDSIFHAFCLRAASEVPAVVLSVEYRLAPENRLPAAIEDGARFLSWLRGQAELAAGTGTGTATADPWLVESADFARTFVYGISAGSNLAHHVIVQVAAGKLPMHPLHVAGYVLDSTFFGSVERTATEISPPADGTLTLEICDQLWRMSLPAGASRDHPLANPFGPDSPGLAELELPRLLLVAPGSDVIRDHGQRYAARLREMGKAVEVADFEGEHHSFSVVTPVSKATDELLRVLSRFMHAQHRNGRAAQATLNPKP